MDRIPLRDFLEIPYDKLEEMNLARQTQGSTACRPTASAKSGNVPRDEKRIKASPCALRTSRAGFHMLDYDKKFLLSAADNLTFDGSSVRGFAQQAESDLRLSVDWSAFYWLPADVFGPGKVLAFGLVEERDGTPYQPTCAAAQGFATELFERTAPSRTFERNRGLPVQGT